MINENKDYVNALNLFKSLKNKHENQLNNLDQVFLKGMSSITDLNKNVNDAVSLYNQYNQGVMEIAKRELSKLLPYF